MVNKKVLEKPKRLQLILTKQASKSLDKLALITSTTTQGEIIRDALNFYSKILEEQQKTNSDIFLENSKGQRTKILIPTC